MESDWDKFYTGMRFASSEDFRKFFHTFCDKYLQPFVVRTRSKCQILCTCRHGRRRTATSTRKRPERNYVYKNCEAQINLYRGKDRQWKVGKVNLSHNHPIGVNEYISFKRSRRKVENISWADDPSDAFEMEPTDVDPSDTDGLEPITTETMEDNPTGHTFTEVVLKTLRELMKNNQNIKKYGHNSRIDSDDIYIIICD